MNWSTYAQHRRELELELQSTTDKKTRIELLKKLDALKWDYAINISNS